MKRCKKCLREYSGRVCPYCGDIADTEKRMKHTAVTVAAVIVLGIIILLIRNYI